MTKAQIKYEDLYLKCKQNQPDINKLNNSFIAAFH